MNDNQNQNQNHEQCPHPNTPDWIEACTRIKNGENPDMGFYEEMSIKLIDFLYSNIPKGSKVDYMRLLESMAYAYFCTLSSQVQGSARFERKIDTKMINDMVFATVNGVGEILAAEGIAMPRIARSTVP